MNLIEVYIQEVTKRLPEKSREDIGLELRSTIEDMLPDDYSEDDVHSILEKLGNPVTLASRYRDQPMYLIGPRYFDVYVSLLKMIVPLAAIVALITMVAKYVNGFEPDDSILNVILNIMGKGIWVIMEVGIQVFFWLTLAFAILERTDKGKYEDPLSTNFKKWTPTDLKSIAYISEKKSITTIGVFGYLIWTAIWATLYFYADHLIGVYEESGAGLELIIPAMDQDILLTYWPMVIVIIVLEIGFAIYKLIIGKWTMKMASFNTVIELISTGLFIVIISRPSLVRQELLTYMSNLFEVTTTQVRTWLVGGAIIIFLISAAMSIVDGFRKARIQ